MLETRRRSLATVLLLTLGLLFGMVLPITAGDEPTLVVVVGESRIIAVKELERVAIADPNVADVVVASPGEILLNGKQPGATSLHLWEKSGRRSYLIKVEEDDSLARQIAQVIGDPGVKVRLIKGAVLLEGTVADQTAVARAEKIARAYSDRVINVLGSERPPEPSAAELKAEAETRAKAEAAAQAKAEAAAQAKAEAEARKQAEADAKAAADRDAKAKAEAEARAKAEADAQAKAKAEAEAQASVAEEQKRAAQLGALPSQVEEAIGMATVKARLLGDMLLLEGTVPEQKDVDRITGIATALSDGLVSKVAAYLTLAPAEPPQVLLQVQVAEVYEDALNKLGIDWGDYQGTEENRQFVPGETWLGEVGVSGVIERAASLIGRIDALLKDGSAKILAAPSLLTRSGKQAEFLAGGEIPVVVYSKDGYTVYWKEYGVKLAMTPEVRPDGRILVHVRPEVSTLDWANGSRVNNGLMPALKTRRAETDVDLRDGATLVIGGLMNQEEARNLEGVPLLSKLPILGRLFSSKSFQSGRTQLVIFVTPRLIKGGQSPRPSEITSPVQHPETPDLEPLEPVAAPAKTPEDAQSSSNS